jgi:hypothetical protein
MLVLRVSLSDDYDSVERTIEFNEDQQWLEIILACADVVSAKYGYDVAQKIKFITDMTSFADRAHDHAIPKAAWEAFLGQDTQDQEEFNFNDFDNELEEMRKWS